MKFGFHPAAEAEHLEQVAYYEAQEAGLGNRDLSQVESAIERVCEIPSMYRVERPPDIRWAAVIEFPFHIIFRERGGAFRFLPSVTIAVAHATGFRDSNKSLHRSGLALRRARPSRLTACAGRARRASPSTGEFKR